MATLYGVVAGCLAAFLLLPPRLFLQRISTCLGRSDGWKSWIPLYRLSYLGELGTGSGKIITAAFLAFILAAPWAARPGAGSLAITVAVVVSAAAYFVVRLVWRDLIAGIGGRSWMGWFAALPIVGYPFQGALAGLRGKQLVLYSGGVVAATILLPITVESYFTHLRMREALAALEAATPDDRVRAVRGLIDFRNGTAASALVGVMLNDSEREVRIEASWALQAFGPDASSVTSKLTQFLERFPDDSRDALMPCLVINTLAYIGADSEQAIAILWRIAAGERFAKLDESLSGSAELNFHARDALDFIRWSRQAAPGTAVPPEVALSSC